jgi:excisionase family DNA binding protein
MSEVRTMSVRGICERYSFGRTKLYALLGSGDITALKAGRKTLIDVASVEAWLTRQPCYEPRSKAEADAHRK